MRRIALLFALSIFAIFEPDSMPGQIPTAGLQLWLEANVGVTATSGSVSLWADQSGNGNNATQTSSGSQPTVVSNALNGEPAIAFSASSSQYFHLPNFMGSASAGEIFVVVKATSTSPSSNRGLWLLGNNGSDYPQTNGQIQEAFGSTSENTVAAPPSGVDQFSVYNVSASSGQMTEWVDGILLRYSNSNGVGFTSGPLLGTDGGNCFDGEIAEVIVYDSVLTNAQRLTVDQYLDGKYNLPGISVPANPTSLTAQALSPTEASLSWSDTLPTTAINYTIWRSSGGGTYAAVATVSNSLSFIDSGLSAGTSYSYKVSSSTWAGSSPGMSSAITVTTPESGTDMPLTGMVMWLKADSNVEATSSGAIIQWLDQSGANNSPYQLTTSSEPTLTSNALNSRPAVAFLASSSQWFNLPNVMNGASSGEVFVVVKATSATPSGNRGLWLLGNNGSDYPQANGEIEEAFGSTGTNTVAAPPSGVDQFCVYNVSASSGQMTEWSDGILLRYSNSNTVGFSSSPLLGTNGGNCFDGEIAEVIIYNNVLTDSQRLVVDRYLDAKYNLPGISIPETPSSLTAQALSPTEVNLAWSDTLPTTAIAYTIWRSTSGGDYTPVATINNALSFVDSGLAAGTSYSYKISSSTWAGSSPGTSSAATVTTLTSGTDMPLSGMVMWLKADSNVEATSSGAIIQWLDQSGENNSPYQLSSAYEPTLTANAQNGRPAVSFAASSNQWFNLPNFMNGASSGEVFVVVKAASATPTGNRGLWLLGNNGSDYPQTNGEIEEGFGSTGTYHMAAPPSSVTQFNIYDVSAQSGQWTSRVNGLELLNNTSNSVGFTGGPLLGSDGGNCFDGEIAEVIVYNSVLTSAQRTTVGEYLEQRYTLPGISVPSNPTGLIANSVSPNEVDLTWSGPELQSGITYTVWRSSGGGSYVAIAEVQNSLSYIDSDVLASTNYSYEISSNTLAGASPGFSTSATVTTPSSGTNMPLTGMTLWLAADRGVQAGASGTISQWLDQSGNGNTAYQVCVSNQPTLLSNALNGRPAVSFVATNNQYFNLGNFMGSAASGEAFVVVKATSAVPTSNRGLWLLGNNGTDYPRSGGTLSDGFGSTSNYSLGLSPTAVTQFVIYDVSAQSGAWEARVNGLPLLISSSNSVGFNGSPIIGNDGGNPFDGEIAEMIVYNAVLSESQRSAVGEYLVAKYDIAGAAAPSNPTDLSATPISASEMSLTWDDALPTGIITYTIWRATASGAYSAVATVDNSRSFVDGGLAAGTQYSYKISSSTLGGVSPGFSSVATATTPVSGTDMPLTGMVLWLKADSQVETASGGTIMRWLDQSGNGNIATQFTAANMPVYVPEGLTGRPTVAFAQADSQYLNLPNILNGASAGEVFVVLQATTPTPAVQLGLWNLGGGNGTCYPNTTGQIVECFGSTTNNYFNLPASNIVHFDLYEVAAQSGQLEAFFDGSPIFTSTSNSVQFTSSPLLGSNGSQTFDGQIAEIIVYNSILSTAQRVAVLDYLGNKYLPFVLISNFAFGLQAHVVSSTEVDLAWNAAPTAASYTIQRSVDGGSWVQIATVSAPTASYSDASVPSGNVINYEIEAIDSANQVSPFSPPVTAFMHPITTDSTDGLSFGVDQMLGINPDAGSDAIPVIPFPTPTPTPTPTENPSINTPPTVTLTSPSEATLH